MLAQNFKIFALMIVIVISAFMAITLLYFLLNANPFCDSSLCPVGKKHIGCYGNYWGPDCENQSKINLTSDLVKMIIDLHNKFRNDAANGSLRTNFNETLPMAERMGIISWHDQLAYLAEIHTYTCLMKHDECRNTKEFKSSGQNIGRGWKPTDPREFIAEVIAAWFDEYKITRVAEIMEYNRSPIDENRKIGHFTVMVNDLQTHVGCGMSTSVNKTTKIRFLLFTCNYSYTNIFGERVYKPGLSRIPCSACIKGCHSIYTFLCAEGENIVSY